VDAAFREERGRVVATLIRRTGDWDLAEECAQEGVHRGAAAMAEIEQNGYYSPPLGTRRPRKTVASRSVSCHSRRSPAIARITRERPPTTRGRNQSQNIPGRSRWRSLGFRYDCGASGQVAEQAWPADRSPLSG